MQLLTQFYDSYHKKNGAYSKILSKKNFTYYYLAPLIRRVVTSLNCPTVLDVGCGVGTLSLFAAQYARSVVGLDISERAIALATAAGRATGSSNAHFFVGELSQKLADFSVIICCEVVEHIPDDTEFLSLLYHNLQPGGVLILSTPLSDTVLAETPLYKKFDAEVGHLRRYTQPELREKITAAGFTIVSLHATESPLRNLLFILHLDRVIWLIRGPLIPLFHTVDEFLCRFLGASNCCVVAQKK